MCLINDNKNFDSVKQFVSLDVGVIPDTGVSIEAGSLYDADTETRVEVVEGDNIALSCYARQGFPPSLVSWEHDITNYTSLRHVMMMLMMIVMMMIMMLMMMIIMIMMMIMMLIMGAGSTASRHQSQARAGEQLQSESVRESLGICHEYVMNVS